MTHLDSALYQSEITGTFIQENDSVLDFHWKDKKFLNAKITGGSFSASHFEHCSFENVIFENVALDHVDFIRCTFKNFQLVRCAQGGMQLRECTGEPQILN